MQSWCFNIESTIWNYRASENLYDSLTSQRRRVASYPPFDVEDAKRLYQSCEQPSQEAEPKRFVPCRVNHPFLVHANKSVKVLLLIETDFSRADRIIPSQYLFLGSPTASNSIHIVLKKRSKGTSKNKRVYSSDAKRQEIMKNYHNGR
ncbi:hypothetical protein RRG08_047232 [Elysia crispata]|uniref:Uncharacterized protein n=1 Tax=Elysia crispata TaxID=231223 RepID=A0AAE1DRN1_9GAST|nr:hypothetical protein RRG08_047232 [Elysia crispata]